MIGSSHMLNDKVSNTCDDYFCNCPHLNLKNSLLWNHYPLSPITQDNGLFELQCLYKHYHFINKFSFHRNFCFQCHNPLSTHAFSHSNLPFPNFFVHVIIFYKLNWNFFSLTCFKPTTTLSPFVPYWHALDMTWPKQEPL